MSGRIQLLLLLSAVAVQAETVDMTGLLETMEANAGVVAEEPVADPAPEKPKMDVAPAGPLAMEDAIALARLNDARLAPFAAALKLAEFRNNASLQRDNPELRLGTDLNGDDPDMRAAVRFFPLHPWAAKALKHENSALAEEGAAAYRGAVLETTLETMTLYHELQCLDKEKALYERLAA